MGKASNTKMSTVKAAVLSVYEKPLEMREYPDITSLDSGEAVVRVEMAGIGGTDIHLWLGQLAVPLPIVLGHETVGRVELLGAGLDKDWRGAPLAIGDRVCWASSLVCGECYFCRVKRQPTRCTSRKASRRMPPSATCRPGKVSARRCCHRTNLSI